MLHLTLKTSLAIPLELDGLTPTRLASLSLLEMAKLKFAHGNRLEELGQFFDISGDCTYGEMCFHGDCSKLQRVGERLESGRIVVDGNIGWHAGARLVGGELVIKGNAGPWLGAEMTGGRIRVLGNAASQVGGAYVGSKFGQRGGEILIHGDAGDECGVRMRRGLIAVSGTVGQFAGLGMVAGSLIAVRGFGAGAGAGMKRGTLFSYARCEVAPGFRYACRYRPAYLGVLLQQLRAVHFEPANHLDTPEVQCYRGDLLTGGQGELLLAS